MSGLELRISSIEGMRAVFAIWVVIHHALSNTGLDNNGNVIWGYLRSGGYAVDLFVIISGFVIFYLLDHKREGYIPYLIRRFFRLFPVFFLLFIVAIPLSLLIPDNANSYSHLFVGKNFPRVEYVQSWWEHIELNIAAHFFMLHGIIPEVIAPGAPIAFLGPAWSISLEWQFYILAPALFILSSKIYRGCYSPSVSALIILSVTALFLIVSKVYPHVIRGAFFPDHFVFFMLGWISYFLSKELSVSKIPLSSIFLICFLLSMMVGIVSNAILVPGPTGVICIWLLLFPLTVSRNEDGLFYSAVFNNKVMNYLGRISYSVYLSHVLVIVVLMKLISYVPYTFGSVQLAVVLVPLTVIVTVVLSHILYICIENPGMKIGKKIASKFDRRLGC